MSLRHCTSNICRWRHLGKRGRERGKEGEGEGEGRCRIIRTVRAARAMRGGLTAELLVFFLFKRLTERSLFMPEMHDETATKEQLRYTPRTLSANHGLFFPMVRKRRKRRRKM